MIGVIAKVVGVLVILLGILLSIPVGDNILDQLDKLMSGADIMDKYAANDYLSGSWAPVFSEVCEKNLETTSGEIPKDLNGIFVRVGANPAVIPPHFPYHLFDGAGMIHVVRLSNGKAHYCNRFVETKKLETERRTQRELYPRLGFFGTRLGLVRMYQSKIRQLLGVIPSLKPSRASTPNTNLMALGKKLYVLHEGSEPFEFSVSDTGDITFQGWQDFNSSWQAPFTAHPKFDWKHEKLFTIDYVSHMQDKQFVYGVLDSMGRLEHQIKLPREYMSMMHEIGMTEHYAVFVEGPWLVFPALVWDHTLPLRIGLFPRYGELVGEIVWLDHELGGMIYHIFNAYEKKTDTNTNIVVVDAILQINGSATFQNARPIIRPVSIRIDVDRRQIETQPLFDTTKHPFYGDFPRINDFYAGYAARYGYVAKFGDEAARKCLEINLETLEWLASFDLGEHVEGGECVFAPKRMNVDVTDVSEDRGEDDGYVLTYAHDISSNVSYLLVFDAQAHGEDVAPIARIALPQRVPLGFHAQFFPDAVL